MDILNKQQNGGFLSASDLHTVVTVASTINVRNRIVSGDSTLGAMLTTLPPVADCAGLFFTFHFATDGGDWTIDDGGDDAAFTILTLADAGDKAMLYSDGFHWHTLEDLK